MHLILICFFTTGDLEALERPHPIKHQCFSCYNYFHEDFDKEQYYFFSITTWGCLSLMVRGSPQFRNPTGPKHREILSSVHPHKCFLKGKTPPPVLKHIQPEVAAHREILCLGLAFWWKVEKPFNIVLPRLMRAQALWQPQAPSQDTHLTSHTPTLTPSSVVAPGVNASPL